MENVRQRHTSPQREADGKPKNAVKVGGAGEQKGKKHVTSPVKKAPRQSCFSRRCCFHGFLATVVVLLCLGVTIGCVVSQSPKDVDEQWEDVQSYAQWWWDTLRRRVPPCTYAGVRHYSWGAAVDAAETCSCHLRRCPPAPFTGGAATTTNTTAPVRGPVTVTRSRTDSLTVEALWDTCEAAHIPVTRDAAVDPLRVFDAPVGAVARGIFANVRTPMCVQSGRVYAALRPNGSLMTISYKLGTRESFYTNLTNSVLQRGAKYHPITTVPAAGLLFTVEGQAGNLFTLIQEGLRGWSALMEQGFGVGFSSDEDKRAWTDAPRQVVFLSDPSMDIPQETKHSSEVARQLANAFTVPSDAPYFATAPLSRTRAGESTRGPMYCFCGGFVIPSIGIVDLAGNVGEAGYAYMRRVVNAHFHGAPLGENDAAAVEAVRTSSELYTPAVRAAWPPRTSTAAAALRPRLLWIGRKRPRIVHEERYIAMAAAIGFEVLTDSTYVTEASAAEQFYLARYADVVVGFHGVALVNAAWMDVTARPRCRTLLEFLPYALPRQVTRVYGDPIASAGVRYDAVEAVDAEFIGAAFASPEKQAVAKRELMGEGPNGKYVMGHSAFSKHRAVYDDAAVEAQLKELYQQVTKCLQEA